MHQTFVYWVDLFVVESWMKFNGIEVPKKVFLIPKSFAEYNCLTTSFKLQRHHAKKTFLSEIEKMYAK